MMIDRIGSTDPILSGKKAVRNEPVQKKAQTDSVSLSAEAASKAELYQAIEIVSGASDVRADRIAELKEKINDPNYMNDTVLKGTADSIMAAFGL